MQITLGNGSLENICENKKTGIMSSFGHHNKIREQEEELAENFLIQFHLNVH